MAGAVISVLLAAALVLLPLGTQALEFEMQTQQKCIYEEINQNVIVVMDFKAFNSHNPDQAENVDVRVEDPHGQIVNEAHGKAEGQVAFTTKIAGEYKACFTARDLQAAYTTKLRIDWRTGVAATDWNAIAKKEHLDSLTVELRKLEDNIREVYSEMLLLQQREQEMRDISEVTNTRVAYFSLASLLVCMLSGTWQLWYLRRFFQRKKLL
uniref:GOLD domain-containing protein n=1 Tax=Chlamydomonas leiostraca TaxID=1034604 RepID=A0A7S0RXE0_9CHLO|mmetsp:Transcript_33412/g.84675  ORF Transcript_33412/g.84675 Transcript_33412/m.84675 type:complete len:210 (+) Transcript_33412:31-660(+)